MALAIEQPRIELEGEDAIQLQGWVNTESQPEMGQEGSLEETFDVVSILFQTSWKCLHTLLRTLQKWQQVPAKDNRILVSGSVLLIDEFCSNLDSLLSSAHLFNQLEVIVPEALQDSKSELRNTSDQIMQYFSELAPVLNTQKSNELGTHNEVLDYWTSMLRNIDHRLCNSAAAQAASSLKPSLQQTDAIVPELLTAQESNFEEQEKSLDTFERALLNSVDRSHSADELPTSKSPQNEETGNPGVIREYHELMISGEKSISPLNEKYQSGSLYSPKSLASKSPHVEKNSREEYLDAALSGYFTKTGESRELSEEDSHAEMANILEAATRKKTVDPAQQRILGSQYIIQTENSPGERKLSSTNGNGESKMVRTLSKQVRLLSEVIKELDNLEEHKKTGPILPDIKILQALNKIKQKLCPEAIEEAKSFEELSFGLDSNPFRHSGVKSIEQTPSATILTEIQFKLSPKTIIKYNSEKHLEKPKLASAPEIEEGPLLSNSKGGFAKKNSLMIQTDLVLPSISVRKSNEIEKSGNLDKIPLVGKRFSLSTTTLAAALCDPSDLYPAQSPQGEYQFSESKPNSKPGSLTNLIQHQPKVESISKPSTQPLGSKHRKLPSDPSHQQPAPPQPLSLSNLGPTAPPDQSSPLPVLQQGQLSPILPSKQYSLPLGAISFGEGQLFGKVKKENTAVQLAHDESDPAIEADFNTREDAPRKIKLFNPHSKSSSQVHEENNSKADIFVKRGRVFNMESKKHSATMWNLGTLVAHTQPDESLNILEASVSITNSNISKTEKIEEIKRLLFKNQKALALEPTLLDMVEINKSSLVRKVPGTGWYPSRDSFLEPKSNNRLAIHETYSKIFSSAKMSPESLKIEQFRTGGSKGRSRSKELEERIQNLLPHKFKQRSVQSNNNRNSHTSNSFVPLTATGYEIVAPLRPSNLRGESLSKHEYGPRQRYSTPPMLRGEREIFQSYISTQGYTQGSQERRARQLTPKGPRDDRLSGVESSYSKTARGEVRRFHTEAKTERTGYSISETVGGGSLFRSEYKHYRHLATAGDERADRESGGNLAGGRNHLFGNPTLLPKSKAVPLEGGQLTTLKAGLARVFREFSHVKSDQDLLSRGLGAPGRTALHRPPTNSFLETDSAVRDPFGGTTAHFRRRRTNKQPEGGGSKFPETFRPHGAVARRTVASFQEYGAGATRSSGLQLH